MAVPKSIDASEAGINAVKTLRHYWFVLIPALLVVRFLVYKLASPLRKYPGPFLASGSRAWKGRSTYHFMQSVVPLTMR